MSVEYGQMRQQVHKKRCEGKREYRAQQRYQDGAHKQHEVKAEPDHIHDAQRQHQSGCKRHFFGINFRQAGSIQHTAGDGQGAVHGRILAEIHFAGQLVQGEHQCQNHGNHDHHDKQDTGERVNVQQGKQRGKPFCVLNGHQGTDQIPFDNGHVYRHDQEKNHYTDDAGNIAEAFLAACIAA